MTKAHRITALAAVLALALGNAHSCDKQEKPTTCVGTNTVPNQGTAQPLPWPTGCDN